MDPHGKGKVFTTVLGTRRRRTASGNVADAAARGFQSIVTRACEWAATGEVTIPLPKELPTAKDVSLAPAS